MSSKHTTTESQETNGKPIDSRNNESNGLSIIEITLKDIEFTNDCIFCLSAITSEETIIKLICGHYYHQNCMSLWLKNHSSCPQCRHQLSDNPFFDKEVESEEESDVMPELESFIPQVLPRLVNASQHELQILFGSLIDIDVINLYESTIRRFIDPNSDEEDEEEEEEDYEEEDID